MKCNFFAYPTFEKEYKRLAKRYKSLAQDVLALVGEIEKNPAAGTNLGQGIYKYRLSISAKGKGKRAGGRAITLNVLVEEDEMEIGFLYIYDKSERTNITDKEIMEIKSKNGL